MGRELGLGMGLVALTIAAHSLGVVGIARILRRLYRIARRHEKNIRRLTGISAALIGTVGLLLAVLHGLEAAVWAVAYLWLGAFLRNATRSFTPSIPSPRAAHLAMCSMRSGG